MAWRIVKLTIVNETLINIDNQKTNKQMDVTLILVTHRKHTIDNCLKWLRYVIRNCPWDLSRIIVERLSRDVSVLHVSPRNE